MIIKELSALESQSVYDSFVSTHIVSEDDLDQDYLLMRNDIKAKHEELTSSGFTLYNYDYRFSIWFYDYMNTKEWFGERIASNYLFWNYIALKVMPDIVYARWGDDKTHEHYFAKGLRVYPYTMFWYAHLSWQGNKEATERILSITKRFSTNSILHLVERPGRYYGTFVDLYRSIMKQYADFSYSKYVDYKKLFESVMKLCMAKTLVIDPYLYEGGTDQFAKDLINKCVLEIKFNASNDEEQGESLL